MNSRLYAQLRGDHAEPERGQRQKDGDRLARAEQQLLETGNLLGRKVKR